jgi:hypothetical protein
VVITPDDNNMPKVPYFLLKELTLNRIELQAGFSELQEHIPQVYQVLLELAANHDRVVQVYVT